MVSSPYTPEQDGSMNSQQYQPPQQEQTSKHNPLALPLLIQAGVMGFFTLIYTIATGKSGSNCLPPRIGMVIGFVYTLLFAAWGFTLHRGNTNGTNKSEVNYPLYVLLQLSTFIMVVGQLITELKGKSGCFNPDVGSWPATFLWIQFSLGIVAVLGSFYWARTKLF